MDIFDKYLTKNQDVETSDKKDDTIFDKYLVQDAASAAADRIRASVVGKPSGTFVEDTAAGMVKGINDVINTGGLGLGFIDEKLGFPSGGDRELNRFKDRVAAENKAFDEGVGETTGAKIGRVGGQIAATAPLLPVRATQAIKAGMGVVDRLIGAAPSGSVINKLGTSVATGGLAGGVYGAATTAQNEKGLGQNVLEGAATGALVGPAVAAGGALAGKIKNSLWGNAQISQITAGTNLAPSAVKNIIARLEEAGISPEQAKQELARLGSKATIADLDPALAAEASGLAQIGGTPTSILKNRYQQRADTADNSAMQIMNSKLGGKPDLTTARERIIEDARNATRGDYEAAKTSGQPIDVSGVVKNIDDQLVNAVGSKAAFLKKVKGYLYRDTKDAQGNEIKELKADIPALHEVRIALDGILERLKNPTNSMGKGVLNAMKDVRSGIDQQLKTNPQMAAADAKFAKEMDVAKGLDEGYGAFGKSNYLDFARMYNTAAPEKQKAIKDGMHAAIGDLMDAAQKGELSGVQRLFAKKSVNREKFKLVLGKDAEEVLDALSQEGAFRNVEREVMHGSQTALRQAVQTRYGSKPPVLGSPFAETLTGVVGDISMGMPALTAVNFAKRGGGNMLSRLTTYRTGNLTSGSADIISRSGAERDMAVDVLRRVQSVQENMRQPSKKSSLRLPAIAPTAISESEQK